MFLQELIDEFLGYLRNEKRYSSHTILSYNTDLAQFSVFLKNRYSADRFSDISPTIIRSWIVDLVENKISAVTVNRKLSSLKSFFKFLRKKGLDTAKLMNKVIAPKKEIRLPEFINGDLLNSLLDKTNNNYRENESPNVQKKNHAAATVADEADAEVLFSNLRNILIIELFFSTGMRLSELINLKLKDVNMFDSSVKVLGKRNKERIIPVATGLKNLIVSYLASRKSIALNSENFFISDSGKKLNAKWVYRNVKAFLGQVPGLRKKSPHILRHTFATAMLNNGAEINAVKELLGHSSLAATQVYTHNTIEKLLKSYRQAHPRA